MTGWDNYSIYIGIHKIPKILSIFSIQGRKSNWKALFIDTKVNQMDACLNKTESKFETVNLLAGHATQTKKIT
jgi:hypothetical protein